MKFQSWSSQKRSQISEKKTKNKICWVDFRDQKEDELTRTKIIVGLKSFEKINHRKILLVFRKVIQLAKKVSAKELGIEFEKINALFGDMEKTEFARKEGYLWETLGLSFGLANYEFKTYKSKPSNSQIEKVFLVGFGKKEISFIKKGFDRARSINLARDLANTPGGDMTPTILGMRAKSIFKGRKVKVQIWSEARLRKEGMGGIWGVGKGSDEESKFIILEYWGTEKKSKPLVLAGKAVTFDSGGINIKPSEGGFLNEMYMDMSGGAAVIGAIDWAERNKVKRNVVGLIPAVENMPSGKSYRPGDVIKTYSQKTVEIGNTDAEGRIILADALSYAKKYQPEAVIDVATLTGASLLAVGQRASIIFSNQEELMERLRNWGEEVGDYLWPMPLWEEYENEIKGHYADINNIGKYGRIGGLATSAAFLYQFAKDYPWVHLDIAPRMTATEEDLLPKGALGTPVGLLTKAIEEGSFKEGIK